MRSGSSAKYSEFLPTLPLRGATHGGHGGLAQHVVSTHTPLAGSDSSAARSGRARACFYPRSPCGERLDAHIPFLSGSTFLPTLPLRGATWLLSSCTPRTRFNPRSPCGERRQRHEGAQRALRFNPRSPCGERPCRWRASRSPHARFNPRSPCGERHRRKWSSVQYRSVSTHAPLAGSDGKAEHLLRGLRIVSTHAPLAGSDCHGRLHAHTLHLFQPTLPLRGATMSTTGFIDMTMLFQPTLPLRGAT